MHIPVLLKEVLDGLDIKENENFVDCTFHMGGHSREILKKNSPNGKVLGIEIDEDVFKNAKKEYKNEKRLILANDSYKNLEEIVKENNFNNISGILLDVGMSSWHVDESKKGFSFQKDEDLQMTYGEGISAKEIVNNYEEKDLIRIFKEYGEERYAKRIAKAIISNRKINTTGELVNIIKKVVPASKINPATRVFQAIRIEANDELNNLKSVLPQALNIINKGGSIIVISFHSLEDKIVKDFIKENNVSAVTRKPITPTKEEIMKNSRSRSAKLRIIKKL